MPEIDFTRAQVADYQAARDVLGRRIRELLVVADACADAEARLELDGKVSELSRRRGALKVGSDEVAEILAEDSPEPSAREVPRQQRRSGGQPPAPRPGH
jgi:hypothetical protein